MGRYAKAIGTGLAGAITTIAIWAITQGTDIEIPIEVAGAIFTIVSAVVTYLVPNSKE